MDNHLQLWREGRVCGASPGEGGQKRPVPLAWWPVMASLVPDGLTGSNGNHQLDGLGLKRLWWG